MHLSTTPLISLFSINIFFEVIAIVLNLVCLSLLISIGRDFNAQHAILLYFASVRILSGIAIAAEVSAFAIHGASCESRLCHWIEIFNSITLKLVCKLMLVVITLDRMFAIVIGLRYHAALRSAYVHAAMMACILLGVLGSLPLYLINLKRHRTLVISCAFLSDVAFIAIALCTFYKIFSVIKKSNKESRRVYLWKPQTLMMPTLIVTSFVLFEVASDAIAAFQSNNLTLRLARNLIHTSGFVSDAVIYIILLPRVRHQLLYNIGKRRHSSLSNVNALEALRMRAEMLKNMRSTVASVRPDDERQFHGGGELDGRQYSVRNAQTQKNLPFTIDVTMNNYEVPGNPRHAIDAYILYDKNRSQSTNTLQSLASEAR